MFSGFVIGDSYPKSLKFWLFLIFSWSIAAGMLGVWSKKWFPQHFPCFSSAFRYPRGLKVFKNLRTRLIFHVGSDQNLEMLRFLLFCAFLSCNWIAPPKLWPVHRPWCAQLKQNNTKITPKKHTKSYKKYKKIKNCLLPFYMQREKRNHKEFNLSLGLGWCFRLQTHYPLFKQT